MNHRWKWGSGKERIVVGKEKEQNGGDTGNSPGRRWARPALHSCLKLSGSLLLCMVGTVSSRFRSADMIYDRPATRSVAQTDLELCM